MSKKKKNPGHTEAVRRKEKATKEMAKIGLGLNDDLQIVGFFFNHLGVSHLNYLGISSINRLCKTYAGIDICIFSQHIIPPCIQPLCPIFAPSDLMRWGNYPLITTSIGTTIEALESNASTIYHYAFDPEFINKPQYGSKLRIAYCDPRAVVIVRHESHKELIEAEFDIKVHDTIVPDCDVEALVKLVLTETKNE
ncbi:hypothetical protein LCGC14_0141700 [marine sediment metagenome]|uniref:Uncharacterized protein n=1 Tax=marine sediment metagenome TaxID=412755 RepID=A0A0F9V125_9ZZZZ